MDTLPLQGGTGGTSNGGSANNSNGGTANGGTANGGTSQGGSGNPGAGGTGQAGMAGNGMAGSSMTEAGAGGEEPDAGGGNVGEPDAGGEDPEDETVGFSEVYPILVASCGGCHGNAAGLPGFARPVEADAYGETQENGAQGQLVAQRIITRAVTARTMPPGCNGGQFGTGTCIDADEAAALQAWLDDGAEP